MTELSMFWNGTTVGDATSSPYDADTEFADVMTALSMVSAVANQGGVLRNALNQLGVTGASSPVSVNTGLAMVHGSWYRNDAAVAFAIPTPSGATRIDRIVLRKGWAAQTVRLTFVQGVEGGGAPALTQMAGTTWDIPIAQLSTTTGGVITITDQRDFLPNAATGVLTLADAQTVTGTKTFNPDTVKLNGALDAASEVGASLRRPTYFVPTLSGSFPATTVTVTGTPTMFTITGLPASAVAAVLQFSPSNSTGSDDHLVVGSDDSVNDNECLVMLTPASIAIPPVEPQAIVPITIASKIAMWMLGVLSISVSIRLVGYYEYM